MSLMIEVPDDLAAQLQERAAAIGSIPEKVAIIAIEQQLRANEQLEKSLAPVRQAFLESGMTEDELSDLLEEVKHDMRRERREKQS
jgi:predicted transcriptional regulator